MQMERLNSTHRVTRFDKERCHGIARLLWILYQDDRLWSSQHIVEDCLKLS
jgi:hypothetical protein